MIYGGMSMSSAFQTFVNYMGTGLVMIWFLLSEVYLFLYEKRKPRRILFVYTPVIILLLYFNPLFAKVFYRLVGEEIYFRICWLMPIIVVISYSVVLICERLKGKLAVGFVMVSLALVVLSGRLVYSSPLYSPAENVYHVPDSVVHICDAIEVPGREVMAVFPKELLLYVRQYSSQVCMPYGRDALMGPYNPFYLTVESETIDLEILVPMARERMCHYLVFRQDQEFLEEPANYGWQVFLETDGYVVYRDTGVELVIPDFNTSISCHNKSVHKSAGQPSAFDLLNSDGYCLSDIRWRCLH